MLNIEIDRILKKNSVTKKHYKGCFPSNLLPEKLTFPCSMVVNFDEAPKPGTHWVAIFAKDRFDAMYFDSLAGKGVDNIEEWLKKNFVIVARQNYPHQDDNSDVCGYYAIFFIYMCSLRHTYKQIEKFLLKIPNPDKYVKAFVCKKIM